MKNRVFAILTLLFLGIMAACSPNGLATEPSQSTSVATTPPPPSSSTTESPAWLQPALADVAKALGISPDQVTLVSSQQVDWPDACLGAAQPGEVCAQVVTSGYQAILNTPKGDIEVHTNQNGESVRIVPPLDATQGQVPAVVWERSGGIAGICQRLVIAPDGSYLLQDCRSNKTLDQGNLTPDQIKSLNSYLSQYGIFTWESTPPAGSADMFMDRYIFNGTGSQPAASDEQQSINDFLANLSGDLASSLQSASGNGTSGIEGQVLIGPACAGPVRADKPCPDQPYQATISVLDSNGNPVTQFQTDAEGRFQISLAPGTYTLQPQSSGAYPRAAEQTVSVTAGQFTQVQISYDSGIR